MRGNRRYRIFHRDFSEYVYRELKGLSTTQKGMLDDDDLKIFKSTTTISDFASNEQLDRLLLMLTKIGKIWSLRIGDQDSNFEEIEFATINQFDSVEKRVDATEAIAREGAFYMSSNEIMMSSMMCAQNISSPVYKLAVNSRDIASKTSSAKSVRIPYDEQVAKSVAGWEDLSKMLLAQLNAIDWALQTLSLETDEIRILAALFVRRESALPIKQIAEGANLTGRMAFLRRAVDKLMESKLIISDAKHGPKVKMARGENSKQTVYYMITPEGIRRIMKYNEYVFVKAFGA